ncbi:MAG: GtrA family protein, partial [Clostridia bacterium]|nr:GtrA family protein [Clostridia bacterium]
SVAFVFSESSRVKNRVREFLVYAVIGIIGLGLTEIIMYILTDLCHFYFMFSKVISAIIVLIWNFVARKKILYTNRGENI